MLIIIISLSLISASDDLIASIDKPKMILNKNIIQGEVLEFEESVIVNNNNDFPVEVILSSSGDWEDRIKLEKENLELEAREREEVFYTVNIEKQGDYFGDILVTFKDPKGSNELSLTQRLIVYVKEVEKESNSTMLIGGIVVLAILFLVVAKKIR